MERAVHRVSVRNLVEFILRSGDINLSGYMSSEAIYEGARIHRKIQKEAGEAYKAEVRLSITKEYDDFAIQVDGVADGVIRDEEGVTVDEIKTVSVPLEHVDEDYNPLHWAQAKCYAYIYSEDSGLDRINVRLTYFNTESKRKKQIVKEFSFAELDSFFNGLIDRYSEWAEFALMHKRERDGSASSLPFPYDSYRKGQRELAVSVYYAVRDKARLFARAPTGIGKTMSVLYPSIKAMGEGYGEKIFYLTAKTTTGQAAEEALRIMRDKGLCIRHITITSREKICSNEVRSCNPKDCPYARGHYDRVNDAILDILRNETLITREVVEEYSQKHMVCPFEYTLDISNWVDCIVCDYNYAFDPRAYLRRYFEEGGDYTLLIDEAHNLVDRAREMFSASLVKSRFLSVKRMMKGSPPSDIDDPVADDSDEDAEHPPGAGVSDDEDAGHLPVRGVSGEDMPDPGMPGTKAVLKSLTKINSFFVGLRKTFEKKYGTKTVKLPTELHPLILKFIEECESFLFKNKGMKISDDLLDLFFDCLSFAAVYRLYDERYVTYATREGNDITLKLFCIDPSHLLDRACGKGRSTVFFSATLMPLEYYEEMLGGCFGEGDGAGDGEEGGYARKRELVLPSPFDRDNLCLMVAGKTSTRYKDREKSLETLASYIKTAVDQRIGNYLVFFPSFKYMESAVELFKEKCPDEQVIIQGRSMTEEEREDFLSSFKEQPDRRLIGFAVMGGVFSEGIDLAGERLTGVVIVGVGLPQICDERDIIRDYFDRLNGMGFEYSYRFPGMNRVLQAAGRVIRTESDRGFILLIDDRFLQRSYLEMYLLEWRGYRRVFDPESVGRILRDFWRGEVV